MSLARINKLKNGSIASSLLFLFCCVTPLGFAQTTAADGRQAQAESLYAEGKRLANAGKSSESHSDKEISIELREAIDKFAAAKEIYRKTGNRKSEGICLSEIGSIYSRLDEDQKAFESYLQAVAVFREIKDRDQESFALGNLGNAYFRAQSYAKAIEAHQGTLAIAKETGDKNTQALALKEIGKSFLHSADLRKALGFFKSALVLFQELGEKGDEAEVLTRIAGTHLILGDKGAAKEWLERSLDFQKKNNFRYMEGEVLGFFGHLYSSLNEKQKALEYYENELSILIELKDVAGAAGLRKQIAGIYLELGQTEKAVSLLREALATYRILNRRSGIASTLRELAEILGEDPNGAEAAKNYLTEAFDLAKQINYKSEQAAILLQLGILYSHAFKDEKQALKYKNESLALYEAIGAISSTANGLYHIGLSYWTSNSVDRAFAYFSIAYALARYTGDLHAEARVLIWLQNSAFAVGGPRLTVLYGKKAVNTFQLRRSKATRFDKESQKTYLRSFEVVYRRLAEQLLDQDRVSEAHQVLQSFKDQQFYDIQNDAPGEPALVELNSDEKDFAQGNEKASDSWAKTYVKYLTLKQSVGDRIPTAEEKERDRENTAALSVAENELGQSLRDPRAAVAAEAKPITTRDTLQIQATLKKLGQQLSDQPVVVYQYVGNDAYYSLVITPTEIKKVASPSNFYATNATAQKFWALLQSDKYDPRPAGKELYDIVFEPIEKELPPGTKTIIWSLDGNLRYVPMAALYDGKQYLVERFNHVTFTRADGDRLSKDVSPVWTAAAFGSSKRHNVEVAGTSTSFSALPGVESELNSIFGAKRARIVAGDVLVDVAFTREKLISTLKMKRPVVHIASHFSFRPGDEEGSFLLLGDGTAFTLADMKTHKDLFAGVELLTLSACNTAAQQADANGREVDAFFELAQRLGAQSVLATLWPVADNSTPWLMREFYDLKVNKNQNKAEALRNAQIALLNGSARTARSRTRADASQVKIVVSDETRKPTGTRAETFVIEKKDAKPFRADPARPFAHPFYWSPFVLIGNWR
jgi:CHAT domain-containing protein